MDLVKRLKKLLEAELNITSPRSEGLRQAIDTALAYIEKGKVYVWKPGKIEAKYKSPIGNFSFFMCPSCGIILDSRKAAASNFKCRKCSVRMVHAYVGAPVSYSQALSPYVINVADSAQMYDPIIAGVDKIPGITCPIKNDFKGLKPRDPNWPIASLAFTCPYDMKNCKYYDNGWCNHYPNGNPGIVIFPQMRGGGRRIPALPSESLTKPYTVSIFRPGAGIEDISDDIFFDRSLGEAYYGRFKVWYITLFYMVGSPYLPRGLRRAVIHIDSRDNLIAMGRSMDVEGVLFRLRFDRVESISKALSLRINVVVHSIAHVVLKAAVRVSGLSYNEFGESTYVDEDSRVAELLVFDDSPGGIGGVKALRTAGPDACHRIWEAAMMCPRSCLSACRGCLYIESCGRLNYGLSWRAAQYYLSSLKCPP